MKGYYVIEFNDQEQKEEISASLSKTKLEYRLILNLKNFVAEKCNVTVIDNGAMLPPVQHHPSALVPIVSDQSSNATANGAQVGTGPSINHKVNGTPPIIASSQPAPEAPINHGVALPLIDTIKAEPQVIHPSQESHPSPPESVDVAPPPVAAPPPNPSTHNRNHDRSTWMNENYAGRYTPFVDRPIVPKVEIIDLSDDEDQEVKPRNMEEQVEEQIDSGNTGLNENHVEEAAEVPNVVDTPPPPSGRSNRRMNESRSGLRDMDEREEERGHDHSDRVSHEDVSMSNQEASSSSTTKSSGRSIKRPNYSMNDDEEHVPRKYKKRGAQEIDELKDSRCSLCPSVVANKYTIKMDHAMIHFEVQRFECMVCGYKAKRNVSLVEHMKAKHKPRPNCYRENQLPQKELCEKMRECFAIKSSDTNNCQLCHHNVGGKSSDTLKVKQNHALTHVDFMLYKCKESDCFFESKAIEQMNQHVNKCHGGTHSGDFKIKLSKEQELEMKGMFGKCFPTKKRLNQNGEQLFSSLSDQQRI